MSVPFVVSAAALFRLFTVAGPYGTTTPARRRRRVGTSAGILASHVKRGELASRCGADRFEESEGRVLERLGEEPTCIRGGVRRHLFGRSGGNDRPAAVAAFRPEVDQ